MQNIPLDHMRILLNDFGSPSQIIVENFALVYGDITVEEVEILVAKRESIGNRI